MAEPDELISHAPKLVGAWDIEDKQIVGALWRAGVAVPTPSKFEMAGAVRQAQDHVVIAGVVLKSADLGQPRPSMLGCR